MFPQNIKKQKMDSTLIIRTVSWAANQYIRMISEDHVTLKNTALIAEIKYFTEIYPHRKPLFEIVIIFHNLTVFLIKEMVSRRVF